MIVNRLCIVAVVLALISGCTSKEERLNNELNEYYSTVNERVSKLETFIKNERMRNILLLKQYSRTLKIMKPELAEIANILL